MDVVAVDDVVIGVEGGGEEGEFEGNAGLEGEG